VWTEINFVELGKGGITNREQTPQK